MGCVPCAAKAAARAGNTNGFEWSKTTIDPETNEAITSTVVYPTEAAAKTKVRKVGGTYKPVPSTVV